MASTPLAVLRYRPIPGEILTLLLGRLWQSGAGGASDHMQMLRSLWSQIQTTCAPDQDMTLLRSSLQAFSSMSLCEICHSLINDHYVNLKELSGFLLGIYELAL